MSNEKLERLKPVLGALYSATDGKKGGTTLAQIKRDRDSLT